MKLFELRPLSINLVLPFTYIFEIIYPYSFPFFFVFRFGTRFGRFFIQFAPLYILLDILTSSLEVRKEFPADNPHISFSFSFTNIFFVKSWCNFFVLRLDENLISSVQFTAVFDLMSPWDCFVMLEEKFSFICTHISVSFRLSSQCCDRVVFSSNTIQLSSSNHNCSLWTYVYGNRGNTVTFSLPSALVMYANVAWSCREANAELAKQSVSFLLPFSVKF